MMDCRVTFTQIIGEYGVRIHQVQPTPLRLLHHLDTPLHISRMAVFQVITDGFRNVRARIERLVAHQHSLPERFPRQFLRRLQTAMKQENTLVVHDVGISIDHGGMRVAGSSLSHNRKDIVLRKPDAVSSAHPNRATAANVEKTLGKYWFLGKSLYLCTQF